jgi:hypothetical protein
MRTAPRSLAGFQVSEVGHAIMLGPVPLGAKPVP